MPNEPYDETLSKLRFQSSAIEANIQEIPDLQAPLNRLKVILARATELMTRQAALTAAKQETSRELAEVILEGRKVLAFLNAGVRFHYGNRSEKLVEFGQQPYRRKARRVRLLGPDGRPISQEDEPEPQE